MTLPSSRYLSVRRDMPIVATGAWNSGIFGGTGHERLDRRGRRPRLRAGQCRRCVPRLAERRRPSEPRADRAQCARTIREACGSPPGSAGEHLALGWCLVRATHAGDGRLEHAASGRRRGRRDRRRNFEHRWATTDHTPGRSAHRSDPAPDANDSHSYDDSSVGSGAGDTTTTLTGGAGTSSRRPDQDSVRRPGASPAPSAAFSVGAELGRSSRRPATQAKRVLDEP